MGVNQIELNVNGMKCGGCVANAEQALKAVPGVSACKVDLAGRSASVTGSAGADALIAALQKAGFPASVKPG
jgi:copper chaperone CopZ